MNEELKAELIIPFASIDHAKIAYNTLRVDTEPRKNLISKQLTLDNNLIKVSWSSHESKILRVSVNSFLDHLNSVLETIELFSSQ
jgi:EKC/KEOPS complex subunit PCC1/LAGE3